MECKSQSYNCISRESGEEFSQLSGLEVESIALTNALDIGQSREGKRVVSRMT